MSVMCKQEKVNIKSLLIKFKYIWFGLVANTSTHMCKMLRQLLTIDRFPQYRFQFYVFLMVRLFHSIHLSLICFFFLLSFFLPFFTFIFLFFLWICLIPFNFSNTLTLTAAFSFEFALVHAHVSPNLTINHNSTYVALFITHTHQNTHNSANVIAKFAYVN